MKIADVFSLQFYDLNDNFPKILRKDICNTVRLWWKSVKTARILIHDLIQNNGHGNLSSFCCELWIIWRGGSVRDIKMKLLELGLHDVTDFKTRGSQTL